MNIKKSIRIIFRNKTYSLLNILGLAVGIACSILIFLSVEEPLSFNRNIPNSDRLYIAGSHYKHGDDINTSFLTPNPLAKALENEFPEVKRVSRFIKRESVFFPEGSMDNFKESGAYTDPAIFEMIGMDFISGEPEKTFNVPLSILISEEMAKKIYRNEDPVGKRLRVEDKQYEIKGVFKNLKKNILFDFDWLMPFQPYQDDWVASGLIDPESWGNSYMDCYVELESNVNLTGVNDKLNVIRKEKDNNDKSKFFIYPINRLRLYGEFKDGIETGGGYIKTVRIFFVVSLIILIIACINFMNLSTARSQKRALEVGVRKTFGGKRKNLIRQFLFESGFITFISLVIAIVLVYFLLPVFNNLFSKELDFNLTNPVILMGLVSIGILCTLLSGSYPAFYLSSFSPLSTLKKQKVNLGYTGRIRQLLIIFQFSAAYILIAYTLVIYLQVQHTEKRDWGIKKENLLLFDTTKEIKTGFEAVQNELLNTGLVESAGLSNLPLIHMSNSASGLKWYGKDPEVDPIVHHNYVSPGLIEAAGIQIVEGKDFSWDDKDFSVIINEAFAELMGSEGRVGGKVGQSEDPNEYWRISAIIKNYVFDDMYADKPEPALFVNAPKSGNLLFVRIKPTINISEAIPRIQSVLRTFTPNEPFDVTYMEDEIMKNFENDQLNGKLFGLFAVLAIFISCLGLFGLSAFSVEQRSKEIAIRKVLGGSTGSILLLLSKSYMILLGIAFAIGIPVAWYVSTQYMKDYSYRISLDWPVFASVALLIVAIALFTISFLTLKAAITNPVKSIKTE